MPDTDAGNDINPPGWVGYLVVSGAAVITHGAVAEGPLRRVLYVLVLLGVSTVVVVAVRRVRPWPRVAWLLLASSLVAAAVGGAVWGVVEAVGGPFVLADAAFLAGFVAAVAGVWVFARAVGGHGGGAVLLDTAIVTVSAAVLMWVLVAGPLWEGVPLEGAPRVVTALYPMLGLVLVALVARLLLGAMVRVGVLWLIGAGLLLVVAADSVEALTALGGFPLGDMAETVRLGGLVIAGSSVLHPSFATLSPPAVGQMRAGPARLVVLWGASVAAPLLLGFGAEIDVVVVAAGSVVLFTLVVARLWLLLSELRAALREEHDVRFRALVDHAQAGMMVVDVDGAASYISASCERVCGHPVVRMGRGYLDMFAPEDRERLRSSILEAGEGPAGCVVEMGGQLRDRAGRERRLELTLANHLATPAISGIVITVHDVTARYDLEQQLASAAQFKDDLLSVASHELRTPLTPILGYLELFERRSDNLTAGQREMVARMVANANRLLRLVDGLLVVRQSTADVLRANREEVVADDVIRSAVALVDIASDDVQIDGKGFRLHVDPQHLEQMVTNLLSNAMKYGRPPVHISVVAGATGRVRLQVRDHGDGVAPELQASMWHRFVQGDRGDTRTSTGTGLGLAIVKLLAEANDGHVRYHDADPAGAVFVVELPGSELTPSQVSGADEALDACDEEVGQGEGVHGSSR